MDMNPQRVRSAEFKTVKRGLDPAEVEAFLDAVADELERAQNQSTAMEARARAAVARLQELSDGAASQAEAAESADPEQVAASVDQSETISRTLLLAQRTADTTIAEARAEADRLRSDADGEASRTLESTREMAAGLLDEAREEARKVGEQERVALKSEVDALAARRDFLESDVDHLEQFLIAQRDRLRDAASELIELTDRVPGGLGEVRRPLMSASDDDDDEGAADAAERGDDDEASDDETPVAAAAVANDDETDAADAADDDAGDDDDSSDDLWLPDDDEDEVADTAATDGESARGFRLSFGDD